MKILGIIVCLLVIATVTHAYKPERVRLFQQNLLACSEEMGEEIKPLEPSPRLFICALRKEGKIFDGNGWVRKYQMYTLITDAIANEATRLSSLHLFGVCYTYATYLHDVTTAYKTMNVFNCSIPIISHFTKPL